MDVKVKIGGVGRVAGTISYGDYPNSFGPENTVVDGALDNIPFVELGIGIFVGE